MEATDASFEEFVAVHGPGLLVFARALAGNTADAEDLLQNALTSAYVRWPRIRASGAVAYVRRSIANGRVSLWRRRSTRATVELDADLPEPRRHDQRDQHDQQTVERLAALQALSGLPRGQRAVLVMRYLLDLSDAEIAETLGVSLSGVRSQAHRGLHALRDQVEPHRCPPETRGESTAIARSDVLNDLVDRPRRLP